MNMSVSLFARDDSDHRNERHFGKHQRPAGISEGRKLHQWLQACERECSEKPVAMFVINVAGHSLQSATVFKVFSGQVQLREYVKLQETIYEVDPKEEECFRFSRVLNFKVGWTFTHLLPRIYIHIIFSWREGVLKIECEILEKYT